MSESQPLAQEIIEQIIAQLDQKLSRAQHTLAEAFIRTYCTSIPLEELETTAINDLYGESLSFFHFSFQRNSLQRKLRIYNPQYEQHGWQSTHTVIDLNCEDMPFLVDSMRIELNRQGYNVHKINHFGGFIVRRDNKNQYTEILGRLSPLEIIPPKILSEAVVHIEIDRQTDEKALKRLEEGLLGVLEDVSAAVTDWQPMRNKVEQILQEMRSTPPKFVHPEEVNESLNFIEWIKDDHFTFLGCRDYRLITHNNEPALALIPGSGLGVLRDESHSVKIRNLSNLSPLVKELVLSKQHVLILTKTNTLSTVHRQVYTDYIGIKRYNGEGEVIGETRIIGLYTTAAYNSHPSQIPFVRHKVATIVKRSGLLEKGHAGKELLNILETLPRDDLFHASTDELFNIAVGILQLQERRLVRLFVRRDVYGRFISCLVYAPRENFNSELRQAMQAILTKAFSAIEVSFDVRFSESVLTRIHFILRVDPYTSLDYDIKAIEQQLIEVSRTWKDNLKDCLVDHYGEEKGMGLFREFGNAFPGAYREEFFPRNAVHDIDHFQKLNNVNEIEMSFYRLIDDSDDTLRFKLFHRDQTIPLSDVVPMLENMGLHIIGERPYQMILNSGQSYWIHDFNMKLTQKNELNLETAGGLFREVFASIWYGQSENDGFNKLVLSAQLHWRQITILRAYAKFLRQTGFMFSQQYIEHTLASYPLIAHLLVQLFELSFKPGLPTNIAEKASELEKQILAEIEKVSSLDEDRILRRYLDVVHATLRTNYFQQDAQGNPKNYLSFKFNPTAIPDMPQPIPTYEIFVYSPRFEAVHLRAAKVARGGIRWSDRREDFRTEILGLMKAQKVKNSVIVPSGAKGGFVPKCLPSEGNREEIMAEVIFCYKNFMRGLLDLTDNIVQGKSIAPANTVCYDEPDPYLVVAADKGTASFSDIANEISKEYQFWLGDAFASGGSAGYDHKKIAITARGAWESVKRHFREKNIDIQKTPFTVVGVGDMSGDVFGNGMLQSHCIKLVAAFDHRNIFIDPTPDPEKSFQERERLFNLPRSSWEDYDATLISAGGGIFKRSAKSIAVSQEMKQLLAISVDQIAPNDLIRAILMAPVDLLWNGGIGTYVKASFERHSDIGDRTNDFVRVNANELRCQVVGEGGNLGFSQLARVEYALHHGACNTDFIDNSAGVDCSDHEVNIKILLNQLIMNGDMTEKQRNTLLAQMTDEVAELVLKDNYDQSLAISLAHVHANTHAELYRRYLNDQEKLNLIDRHLEFLPNDKELIERKVQNISLTRPELAVLISYSKINAKAEILLSDLPEDPYLSQIIYEGFPPTLRKKFALPIQQHSLRREIIATQLSSGLVNQVGAVFIYRMQHETGASAAEIIRAYVAIKQIFKVEEILTQINALDYQVDAALQIEMLLHIKRLIRRATRWLLRNRRTQLDIKENVAYFSAGVDQLIHVIPSLMVGVTKDYMENLTQQFLNAGLNEALAVRIAGCRAAYTALNIVDVATQYQFDLIEAAKVFFAVGAHLELAWFRDQMNISAVEDYWDSLARASLRDDLDTQQRDLTISILRMSATAPDINTRLTLWLEQHHQLLERWFSIINNMRSASNLTFIMFYVAVRELSDIINFILSRQMI